jgi:hypothetical protein
LTRLNGVVERRGGSSSVAVTADYQYEFNGVLMGAGQEIMVERISGLLTIPKPKIPRKPNQARHGSRFPGRTLLEDRVITFDVHLLTATGSATEAKLELLGEKFEPSSLILPFSFQRPGRGIRRAYCKCERVDFEANYRLTKGDPAGSIELVAADPFYYSEAETTTAATINAGQSTVNININNVGKRSSERVRVVITGTATNPIIQNSTDSNRQLRTTGLAVGGADSLEFDLFARSLKLNGADAYTYLRNDNQWFELKPGVNTLVFSRTGTTGSATITVHHRNAWVI